MHLAKAVNFLVSFFSCPSQNPYYFFPTEQSRRAWTAANLRALFSRSAARMGQRFINLSSPRICHPMSQTGPFWEHENLSVKVWAQNAAHRVECGCTDMQPEQLTDIPAVKPAERTVPRTSKHFSARFSAPTRVRNQGGERVEIKPLITRRVKGEELRRERNRQD